MNSLKSNKYILADYLGNFNCLRGVHELKLVLLPSAKFAKYLSKISLQWFESTRMPYEILVARFWLRVGGVPRALVAVSHVIKDKDSGVENAIFSRTLY